jgi:hypothetical protein
MPSRPFTSSPLAEAARLDRLIIELELRASMK